MNFFDGASSLLNPLFRWRYSCVFISEAEEMGTWIEGLYLFLLVGLPLAVEIWVL
jgi:hypothetical protein